jgi:lysophospholipase L1-like esterase
MKRLLVCLSASLIVSACSDFMAPPVPPPQASVQLTAQELFATYVSLGTSISMGVQAAGVFDNAQHTALPAQLAARAGSPFSLPLIQDPGCPPPLLAPLAANLVLIGAFAAFGSGGDFITALGDVCRPLYPGIVLPTNNVAISGARAHDALYTTPAIAGATSASRGALYRRVLREGQTQVTEMQAQSPTLVSVELATNEVLPAATGRIAAMTPYLSWQADYDQIIAAVQATGARAVIVGLPNNAANFPSLRRAREFFNQWPYLLTLGIKVSINCYFSSNYLFIPGYILTLLSKAPTTATCSDVPGAVDYVLTPGDISAINTRMAQMNAHMEAKANENGYAFFRISVLYDLPKVSFNLYNVLFSSAPFGPYMSLDGVHPNTAGHGILATAAAQAISAKYGVVIP